MTWIPIILVSVLSNGGLEIKITDPKGYSQHECQLRLEEMRGLVSAFAQGARISSARCTMTR